MLFLSCQICSYQHCQIFVIIFSYLLNIRVACLDSVDHILFYADTLEPQRWIKLRHPCLDVKPTSINHKTFLFLNCSCCLCSHFSGLVIASLHRKSVLQSSVLHWLCCLFEHFGAESAITCSSLPGCIFQGCAAHLQRSWHGVKMAGTLLLSGPCSGPGDVAKAAEGCADSVCPCWAGISKL